MLRPKAVVEIFEDPLTKLKLEGKAILLGLENISAEYYEGVKYSKEYWKVKFLEDGLIAYRTIYVPFEEK